MQISSFSPVPTPNVAPAPGPAPDAAAVLARQEPNFRALGADRVQVEAPDAIRLSFDDPRQALVARSLMRETVQGVRLLFEHAPTTLPLPSLSDAGRAISRLDAVDTYAITQDDAGTRLLVIMNRPDLSVQDLLVRELGNAKIVFNGW
jgi:hypothetical protein